MPDKSFNSNRSENVPNFWHRRATGHALKAAVLNGADAVYFGLSDFNARKRATNFSCDELPKVIEYCHNHNVKGLCHFQYARVFK